MNKKALSELSAKCHECIEACKVENWRKPLDIEFGGIIEHCRMYGGDEIQELYEEVWDGVEEDDPEVQSALWKLERHLFFINMKDDVTEDGMTEDQIERLYIGKRIAMLRSERGMTQTELAERAGIGRGHIVRIEQGRYSVGIDILSAIGNALGQRVDFIEN